MVFDEEKSGRSAYWDGVRLADCRLLLEQKFMLLSLKWEDKKKLVVRTLGRPAYHYQIVENLEKEIRSATIEVGSPGYTIKALPRCQIESLGGGLLLLRKVRNSPQIQVCGASHDYGRADHKTVAKIIKESLATELALLGISIVVEK